jgi:hypothetical protein
MTNSHDFSLEFQPRIPQSSAHLPRIRSNTKRLCRRPSLADQYEEAYLNRDPVIPIHRGPIGGNGTRLNGRLTNSVKPGYTGLYGFPCRPILGGCREECIEVDGVVMVCAFLRGRVEYRYVTVGN